LPPQALIAVDLSDGAAGIPIVNVTERLTSKQRDTLYESRINPIASFPSTGIVVFGQKTLQERPSALDRINVRRLVIFLKKKISILSSQSSISSRTYKQLGTASSHLLSHSLPMLRLESWYHRLSINS
jgi:hypothetical protein